MVYGDLHKYFLRSLMNKGVMTEREASGILTKFEDGEEESIRNVVKLINEKIQPFHQKVKIVTNEANGESELVFLSFGDDDASKVQGIFSTTELDYFRTILQDIVTSQHRNVNFVDAVNAVTKINGTLSKTEAQTLLDTWCKMGYLFKSDNKFNLGSRGIYEFETYIRTNIPSAVEECGLCNQTVYQGYNCPSCGVAVHTRCLNKYLEKIDKWPCCSASYDNSFLLTQQNTIINGSQHAVTNEDISLAEEVMASIANESDAANTSERQPDSLTQRRGRKRQRE